MDEKRAAGIGLLPRPSPVDTTPEEPASSTAAVARTQQHIRVSSLLLGDRLPEELVGRGETLVLVLFVAALIPLSALSSLAVALLTIFIPPRALLFQRYVFAPGIKLLAIGAALVLSDSVELVAVAYVF